MGFDVDINLKWFPGISKPKKIYDHFLQQNTLNWVLWNKVKFNYTLTSKRDNLNFHMNVWNLIHLFFS